MKLHGGAISEVFAGEARAIVVPCDCRFGLSCMPSDSVDAIVCDPPYGIGFMGKEWDSFAPERVAARVVSKARKGTDIPEGPRGTPGQMGSAADIAYDRTGAGNRRFQAWCEEWASEAFRVLKPGGHLLAFGGTRTYHRLACGIEDAGFQIRDSLAWLYASGFPKSLNVSKAIEAMALTGGSSPRQLADAVDATGQGEPANGHHGMKWDERAGTKQGVSRHAPGNWTATTDAARDAEGYGTALKPAFEPIIVARKPLDGTVAANWLKYGTGAINIDGCRIVCTPEDYAALSAGVEAIRARGGTMPGFNTCDLAGANPASPLGRWPANVVLTHAEGCERIGTRSVPRNPIESTGDKTGFAGQPIGGSRAVGVVEEAVESWCCVPGCPVAELDAQSGERASTPYPANVATGAVLPFTTRTAGGYSDSGGASRFFFTPKASRSERDAGLDDFAAMTGGAATDRKDGAAGLDSPRAGAGRHGGARNTHPTVKPIELMRWLVRLVTRPGSIVLDPFCGSGSTGVATMLEGDGRRFIGLELEPKHVDFARNRIAHYVGGKPERVSDAPIVMPVQMSIFEALAK